MATSNHLPTKVQALLSSLDREQIAYTLEVTELGNHRTGYSVQSVDGLLVFARRAANLYAEFVGIRNPDRQGTWT